MKYNLFLINNKFLILTSCQGFPINKEFSIILLNATIENISSYINKGLL